MLNGFIDKICEVKRLDKESTLIYIYRYFSLIICNIFYLISDLGKSFKIKLFVVASMTLASIIMNNLFAKNRDSQGMMKVLTSLDILGNILILIPTGGLNSPYIWYSFNTVLITSSFLNICYTTFIITSYIILSSEIYSYITFEKFSSMLDILKKNHNFILAYLLITGAGYELFTLLKQLNVERENLLVMNKELNAANSKIKESIDHMLALYKTVNYLNHQSNIKSISKVIIEYSQKIIKSENVFLFLIMDNNSQFFDFSGNEEWKDEILKYIQNNLLIKDNTKKVSSFNLQGKKFICSIINTSQNQFGFLGFQVDSIENNKEYRQNLLQGNFLSELCTLVLEKMNLEKINNHLIISEEKNRIANDIHDGVCQKLFSISCSVQTLKKKLSPGNEGLREDIDIIKELLSTSIKELRETIYGLSWNKFAEDVFMVDLKEYINNVSRICNIDIQFITRGNDEFLDVNSKIAIYRIITETVSNAMRHGKANKVIIELEMLKKITYLTIKDDGEGFQVQSTLDASRKGLGLNNVFQMVNSLNGSVNIESQEKGTTIKVIIPRVLNFAS
ncbi:Histidine kinase-, DNA gyrase B-, and HSP90-like ATPase [Clostridium amylolyticum]|uniref:histidine kinase n=1 Tax=Clostridium amylolyticum TaxID=1121298 RepID=A0A1M6GRG9_9CLOT|nr:histidine kinase [Clostridium amylolyticum]SHJ12508.1 Histidine kinase-, DNA gyrase B-, and HSP90-like ATPase [Clostridium amylolyticum]